MMDQIYEKIAYVYCLYLTIYGRQTTVYSPYMTIYVAYTAAENNHLGAWVITFEKEIWSFL